MIQLRIFLIVPVLPLVSCLHNTNEPAPIHRKMFGLVEKFDRFDENGDGYLTRRELESGVEHVGTLKLTGDQLDRVMHVYDTNHDKKVSLREAQAAARKGPILFEQ